jgi:hypothetical protein
MKSRIMHRVDANQRAIVVALRDIGASVQSLATVGNGCPDILVGRDGQNWLFEIKDPTKPPSGRRLTAKEDAWHCGWRGQVAIVETADDALCIIRTRREI